MLFVESESTRAVLVFIATRYRDQPFIRPGKDKKYIGFDDCCHLMRYAEKVKHLHPKISEYVTDVRKVVDKFHFKAHRGVYCKKYANPNHWPDLKDVNMSIAEQYFKRQAKFKYTLRHMNAVRFNFMLQYICLLDQRARDMGMVAVRSAGVS